MQNDDEETDAEVSIGTEIPDHDQIGDIPSQQLNPNDENDDNHGNHYSAIMCVTNRSHNLLRSIYWKHFNKKMFCF